MVGRRALSRLLATTVVIAALATSLSITGSRDSSDALAAGADFAPLANATSVGPAAFGQVVTDGEGNFLSVHRLALPLGQYIGVKRSMDGGRTWTTTALFDSSSGGVTRPVIDLSGDRAAVAYIGSWCDPAAPSLCYEAPYLATSNDGGASWTGPRRLDRQAFGLRVAQDGARTWVAWERGGTVELRGTRDGGNSWFASRSIVGRGVELAAGGGVAVLAHEATVDASTRAPQALIARGDVICDLAEPLADPFGDVVVRPIGAAIADGQIHVLTRSLPQGTFTVINRTIDVRTAGPDGVFDNVHHFGDSGWSASIVAERGLVAVAVGELDGVTSVATSGDGGATFSELVPIASTPDGHAPHVNIGATVRRPDRPIARFTWSVPDRLVDDDGDGFPDPANDANNPSVDALRVYGGLTMDLTLDGCSSLVPAGRTVESYRWTELLPDGSTSVLPFGSCRPTFSIDSGDRMTLRFDVTDSAGERASTVQVVEPRDLVVVSLGDSVASGEGNPHQPVGNGPAIWQDRSCHRSMTAGPARAAHRLERSDPHTSVTFIQLACSGAAIVDSPEVAGIDDPATGGLLDQYHGQEALPGSLRPSQVDQLREMLGNRTVDALMLSIGANDTRFSDALKLCIVVEHCHRTRIRTAFEEQLADLPSRYARLSTALTDLRVAASDVHISEYFDPSMDELGVIQMRCAVTGGLFDLLDDDEARWASTHVMGGLNAAVGAAATTHGWNYVGGIAKRYARHGYCSNDRYLVQIAESLSQQGDPSGAFHPNAAGHEVYGTALYASLRSALLVPPPAGSESGPGIGRQALGELMVLSATSDSITVTALRDTGGAPALLGSRIVDRVVSGDGGLGVFGPPAVGSAAAVGVWTQVPTLGWTATEEWAGQLAVSPNVAVRSVDVVQAPVGERYLIADRESLVLANIEATIEGPQDVEVSVDVSIAPVDPDDPDAPPGRPLLAATSMVTLKPGMNHVLLPKDQTFALQPGEIPVVTVTVVDPDGADPADDLDNEFTNDPSLDPDASRETLEGRPLTLQFVTVEVPNGNQVRCSDLSNIARRQVAFARAALPVAPPGILVSLGCGDLPPIEYATEEDVLAYLGMLDWLARQSEADALVGVVPPGWLQDVAGGAVGAAAHGRRAIILEQTAPGHTLAHEIAHTFGISEHAAASSKVVGVRVDQRRYKEGIDWMAARTPATTWTGASTWNYLAVAIGPPGGVPAPPDPLSDLVEITGTVDNDGNHQPEPWTPGDTGSPRFDHSGLDELQLERMLVEQMDGTTVLASEPVPMTPLEGLYAPTAPEPTGPIGWTYGTRIALLPAATSVRLVLDGAVVDERPVTAVPEVTVTAPLAGTVVGRGEQLVVEWSTAAPVSGSSTATILGSQDGGTTWKPLAVGVLGTSASVIVPRDMVNGPAVVRVVVHDGLRAGRGDSAEFTVSAPITVMEEKVVAVRHDLVDLTVPGATMPNYTGNGIWTMNTDGTDFEEVVPLVPPVDGQGGMLPLHPDWRGDAGAIAFDGQVSGRRDLYVVNPDGTGLRQITNASSDEGRQFLCADWHPDGVQILALMGQTLSVIDTLQLVSVDSVTGAVTRFRPNWTAGGQGHGVQDRACPRWSDDGEEVLFAVERSSNNYVYVIDVATQLSKYAYSVNHGALEGVAYNTWLDFAPGDDDRFLATTRLFSTGYVRVAAPTPVFIVDQLVPMPRETWSTSSVNPPISQEEPLFGSAGFTEDGTGIWFTSTNEMTPRRIQRTVQFNFQFWENIETQPVGHFCQMPAGVTPAVATCYAPGGDGTPVDEVAFTAVRVPDPPPVVPTVGVIQADVHPGITRTDDQSAVIIEDPATLPPDPEDDPPADATTPSPELAPAPDADDTPPTAVPAAASATVTVVAGVPTPFVVRTPGGEPLRATIVSPPPPDAVTVEPVPPTGGDPTTTGHDGEAMITPAPGFTGRTTFQVSAPGSGEIATITVDVVPLPAPVAVDDTVVVEPQTPTTIDPATLLANDLPTEPAVEAVLARSVGDLRVVSVHSFSAGTAVLNHEGTIEILVEGSRGGTFSYVIADDAGATSTASVAVLVPTMTPTSAPTSSPTTTPPTTSPTSTSPSTSPPTTSPPPITSDAGGVTPSTPVPPAAPTLPVGELPSTGSDLAPFLRLAAATMIGGVALLLLVHHRRRRATAQRG